MKWLRRLSIRARLTVAFSAAMLVVLALAATLVYVRVDHALIESRDESLRARQESLRAVVAGSSEDLPSELRSTPTLDSEDNFSQILAANGRVLFSTLPKDSEAAISPKETARAAGGDLLLPERDVVGVDGSARILAGPAPSGSRTLVALSGVANQDRTETLSQILAAFSVGAPLALLLAAGAGYLLARRALLPVELMRARADGISGEGVGERLPVPEANDELQALAVTLNSLLERLEQALDREKNFVADASHELRTPLAILKTELELAEQGNRSPDELRAAIVSALGEVDRLARLADDLLIAARADRGAIPIRRETVDVGELLGRVSGRAARAAAHQARRIERSSPEGLSASIDPLRAEQALGNLIDNALRHGSGAIRLDAGIDAGELVVEVSDEGGGFSEEFRDHAFERFSRADPGRGGGGAGLGLAIVAAVAAAHGGRASISEDPSSSAVRISFGPAQGGTDPAGPPLNPV